MERRIDRQPADGVQPMEILTAEFNLCAPAKNVPAEFDNSISITCSEKGCQMADARDSKSTAIIEELQVAYWMELETVMNYLANSINLDGVRAEEIKKALAADVAEELSHAQSLARRIKTIGGRVPGSKQFRAGQDAMQPPQDSTDLVSIIRGVIAAEDAAIEQYNKLIQLCDGVDYVTQDLCIQSLADEEQHRRDFVGYLTEYENRG